MADLQLPPLVVRDQSLRLYLEALAREIAWIKANCCDDCGCGGSGSGGGSSTGTSSGTSTTTQTGVAGAPSHASYTNGSGAYTAPQMIYDLGSSTTLSSAELNRIHYVNATAAVDINLPDLQPGQSVTIVNTGTFTLTIKDSSGNTVGTVAAGDVSGPIAIDASGVVTEH